MHTMLTVTISSPSVCCTIELLCFLLTMQFIQSILVPMHTVIKMHTQLIKQGIKYYGKAGALLVGPENHWGLYKIYHIIHAYLPQRSTSAWLVFINTATLLDSYNFCKKGLFCQFLLRSGFLCIEVRGSASLAGIFDKIIMLPCLNMDRD